MVVQDMDWQETQERAQNVAERIASTFSRHNPGSLNIYGVPRGGIHTALMVAPIVQNLFGAYRPVRLVETPQEADVIVDDIVDSGATKKLLMTQWPEKSFYALVDKRESDSSLAWVSFPWERMRMEDGPQENIRRILEFIGEDPDREGLVETPDRVIKSFAHLFSGYARDPKDVMKTFGAETYDEMVLVKDIEFYSTCEHHMQPFFGTAAIAYIPNGHVIGVSKLARVLEIYSRRLQIQERLCDQVTSALMEHLQPKGAACVLEAKHFCMLCRGVEKQSSSMVTSSLKGVFREPTVRQEFLNFVRG